MLPPGFPSNVAIRDLTRIFGGTSCQNVLIQAPRVTDNNITQFLVGLEDYINEDPDLSEQIAKLPGRQGKNVPEILRKPVPIIQNYLSPFIANVEKGIADSGFNIKPSGITSDLIKAQTGKDFRQTVEEEYLSVPDVRRQMVGRQKFITSDYGNALVLIKQNPALTDNQQIALANNLEKLFRAKLAAFSTCAGFLIIMLSQIEPLKRFGGVTAFGIFWSLIASLTLVPALLYLWSGHRSKVKKQDSAEPEPARPWCSLNERENPHSRLFPGRSHKKEAFPAEEARRSNLLSRRPTGSARPNARRQ